MVVLSTDFDPETPPPPPATTMDWALIVVPAPVAFAIEVPLAPPPIPAFELSPLMTAPPAPAVENASPEI